MRRISGARVAVALLAASAVFAAAAPVAAKSDPPKAPKGDAFYEGPDELPDGEPGDLIWSRSIDAPKGAKGWRVLYLSESVDGDPIVVSGMVFAPTAKAKKGGRPVVTWAHGTTGVGDDCTPSKDDDAADGIPFLEKYLKKGYVVVASDYEGLGTPGLHPYLVGESEGRGVLDIVRAARQIKATKASKKVVISGHSQGGHSALFAALIAPEWAPELDVRGVAPGAPASDLTLLYGVGSKLPGAIGLVVMAGYGYAAAYPELDPAALLTPEAAADATDLLEVVCVEDFVAAFADRDPASVFVTDALSVPEWRARVEENTIGPEPIDMPVFIFQGADDALIPAFVNETVTENLCDNGTDVALKVYESKDHESVVPAAQKDVIAWVADRFAGKAADSTCG